jgi:hypothetical protein
MEQVVFMETDTQLDSATSFSQYIYQSRRLITMIGERHEQEWKCTPTSLSVADYCKTVLKANTRCKIMLEYNKGDNPVHIGSHAIREVYKVATGMGKTGSIIPFDTRAFFLGVEGQADLYGSGYAKYKSWESVGMTFIEPFYQRIREDEKLFKVSDQYDPSVKNYLENVYVSDMEKKFRYIAGMFGRAPAAEIHQALKDAWKKVADFFILRALLRNDNTSEYIVIMGEAHHTNLAGVLKSIAVQLNQQSGSPKKCVRLYETYRLEKEI